MPLASCNSQPKAKIYCLRHISFLKRYWRCKIKKWYHAKVAHLWHQNAKPWITWREICKLPWVPETFRVSFQFICKSGLHSDPRKSRKVFHALCPLSPKSDQHEISPYNINSLENIVVMRIEYVNKGKMSLIDILINSPHYLYCIGTVNESLNFNIRV